MSSTSATSSSTSSVSAIGYTPQTNTTALPDNTKLTMDDFLQIMVTSLKQQDPEQPQDPTSYYQQVLQMSTYQATVNMEQNTEKLVNGEGMKLVGSTVNYDDPNNNGAASTGVVTQVNFSSSGTSVTVNGSTFDVGYITSVVQPSSSSGTSGSNTQSSSNSNTQSSSTSN